MTHLNAKKWLVGTSLFIGLLMVFSCTGRDKSKSGETNLVNYRTAFLVDVRTPEEFLEGSVPGAVNIPLDVLETKLDLFKNKSAIVLFCRTGNRAGQAKTILMQHGLTNVFNGGSWQEVNSVLGK